MTERPASTRPADAATRPSPSHDTDRPSLHVLREYALLADGERGCLVGPSGDIAWMCFPGWADDAVFASLLGGAGTYAVRPSGPFVWGGWYEPGTLVWRGRFVDEANAIVECRDALALPATGRRAIVLRRLIGLSGRMTIDVTLEASSGFGTEPLRELARAPAGGWRAWTGAVRVGWWGADDAGVDEDAGRTTLRHVLELAEGETHDLVLLLSCDDDEGPPDPDLCWASTENGWQERVPTLGLALAERDSRHAWAVLSGLTSSGGGMVAAATMGLPERANEGRSYDYRYVWIRDQAYAARAAVRGGGLALLDAAVRFTRDRLLDDGEHLTPAYTSSGDRIPAERPLELPGYPGGVNVVGNHVRDQFQLDVFGEALLLLAEAARRDRLDAETWHAAEIAAHAIESRWQEPDAGIWELGPDRWTAERPLELPGYPGGVNVVGNHVRDQFQLDVFGEALLLLAEAARHDRLDAETWHAAEIAARAIESRWQEPDHGIWELGPDHWTVSRLLCAAGLRAIAAAGPVGEQSAGWLALADTIVADTASHAVHRSGRWQRSPTDRRIDAALLLPALRGAVPADDPRSVATLEAVLEELSDDGYVYRFRPDSRSLGEAEGAFLLCGFLVSLALLQRGDTVASARWFERTRAACGPPGLLSEEFDVRQRQLRGNLPQAFVHAELLECALAQAEGAL